MGIKDNRNALTRRSRRRPRESMEDNLHSPHRRLIELRIEHADLDNLIDRAVAEHPDDELALRRLKKRRLLLRDQIARLESRARSARAGMSARRPVAPAGARRTTAVRGSAFAQERRAGARPTPRYVEREVQLAHGAWRARRRSSAREALVVEAGTGVGKTFAYLVPTLLSGARALDQHGDQEPAGPALPARPAAPARGAAGAGDAWRCSRAVRATSACTG